MAEQAAPKGPDFTQGFAISDIPDGGMIGGHVGEEAVLLARRGKELFAIGATCSHYGGPLAEGLVVGDTVRCPWHHACFSLRTGEALSAPAFGAVSCWRIEKQDDKIFVREKVQSPRKAKSADKHPDRIVIIGGGGAGFAAAEMLRREGFERELTIVSADDDAPYDRPNCSKDYLAGNAPEEWMPLRPDDFYKEQTITLKLASEAREIDASNRQVKLSDGSSLAFDKLLIATGSEPIRLDFPGAKESHVHLLRSLSDSRAIIQDAQSAKRAVVIGASFIGLEVAAALRARKIEVHVVAPEKMPLERILGREFGAFVLALHEEHGVVFHLEDTVAAIDGTSVKLKSGPTLGADLLVMGAGVRPRIAIAEKAGLKIDRGVAVNEFLETSVPGIFAAGDIARWPDRHSGEALRIEHWVVAERQGQAAARNMLGRAQPFADVPFFWSQHYDVPINYVGHAEKWDKIEIDGDIKARDCVVRYLLGGKIRAVASIYRDVDNLKAAAELSH